MNTCIFIGYVYKKPELKTTQSGISVTEFELSVPRGTKTEDGKRQYDYITVQAWRETAERCTRYLDDGTKICVTTSLKTESYEKDGVKRKKYTFVLQNFDFCGSKGTGSAAGGSTGSPETINGMGCTNYTQMPQVPHNGAQSASQDAYNPDDLKPLEDDEELPF